MAFNDFQLEGLKERIGKMLTPIDDEQLLALLARLDAAEQNAAHVEGLLSVIETLDALDWGEEGPPCNWDGSIPSGPPI